MSTFKRFAGAIAACAAVSMSPSAGAAPPQEHFGMCDASAAVAVGADQFLVANDEDNVLRLYRSKQPGSAVQPYPMATFLRATDESDIEGAARIGNRVYWISSHGAIKNGKPRPDRRRLFATDLVQAKNALSVTPAGQPYTGLLAAMAAHPPMQKYKLLQAAEKAPESDGALNIEGLAATPEGFLLIGFRNPVPMGKALLLPLENPNELLGLSAGAAAANPVARFGTPIELSLGGLGIRDMVYAEKRRAYLIVAGPHGSGGGFKLFAWSPSSAAAPVQLPIDIEAGLRPEAIFALADGKSFQLLSDDGDERMGGTACKELKPAAQRKFRSVIVRP